MFAQLAALALLLPALVHAGTFDKPVIALNPKEFNKVMKDDRMSMVVFYAPWCGHCKSLAPEYAQAATSLSPIIPFYSVDCDEDAHKPLCAKYDVKGFPTIKGFTRGNKIPPKDYTGERKRPGLVGWASSMVGDKVKKMKVPNKGGVSAEEGMKEVEAFLKQDPSKTHVFLLHPTAASVPLMWKALSQQSFATHSLGYIRDADSNLRRSLGLGGDGAKVVYWPIGSTDPTQGMVVYDGPLKHTELTAFLLTGSGPTSSPGTPSSEPSPSASSNEPAPPNASQLKREADRAKAQARWAEEERRDQARLQRMAERKAALLRKAEEEDEGDVGTGSGTEEAGAEPAKAPTHSTDAGAKTGAGEPEPAGSPEVETDAAEAPRETGKETMLTEEQEHVAGVVEDNVGGQDEEVEPELKVVELETEERKRDEL